MMHYIISILLFVIIFSGDFSIIGISTGLAASLLMLGIRLQYKTPIIIKFHLWYVLTLSLLIVELINGMLYSQTEAIMRVQTFFAALILMVCIRDLLPNLINWNVLKWIAALLLIGALLDINAPSERGFIFGPNILYRTVLLPFFNSGFLLVTLITLGISVATLSRGAFVTGLILALWQLEWKKRVLVSLSIATVGFLLLQLAEVDIPRFATFYDKNGSNSISDRYSIVNTIFDNLSFFGRSYASFQKDYSFITYPHNSIIELNYFYGIFGFMTGVYLIYLLSLSLFRKRSPIIIACILPTLLSGNLVDNFIILTLAAAHDT